MSALTRPRGPLAARVYWTRRLLVLGTALALVLGLGMMLSRFSDGSGGGGAVTTVSAQDSGTTDPSSGSTSPAGEQRKEKRRKQKEKLPEPSGPCLASDIDATPVVKDAEAGRDVKLRFRLATRLSLACTWQASSDTLTLKVTSGKDLIWTSQQCPKAVPTKDLVLRRDKARWVNVSWSGRRSDEGCPRATEWSLPGWYHVSVAPLGGEPEDTQFKLHRPQPEVVTASPSPEQKGDSKDTKKDKSKSGGQAPTEEPTGLPSGAVEPNG